MGGYNQQNISMLNLRVFILIVVASMAVSTVIPHVEKVKAHHPRTYNVSLDDTPLERWRPILKDYKHALGLFINMFELLPISEKFFDLVDWYGHKVFKHQDFVQEVDALATLSGHPFGKLFFLNFLYEYSTIKACTGILVRNYNGKILHGRNLDFEMWGMISGLIVNIDYYQGKKLIYSVDTVVGSVFALTGIRHGAFAINCDTRKGTDILSDLLSIFWYNAIPNVWLLRKILENEVTYANALDKLLNTRIAAPIYYVISGVKQNQGAVIERDPVGYRGFYQLTKDNWFLIQTNYDRDDPDPVHDPRRIGTENRLRKYGNGITEKKLLDDFLSIWPTWNIGTIMSTVMVPGASYHNTTVWYSANPSGHQTASPASATEEQ